MIFLSDFIPHVISLPFQIYFAIALTVYLSWTFENTKLNNSKIKCIWLLSDLHFKWFLPDGIPYGSHSSVIHCIIHCVYETGVKNGEIAGTEKPALSQPHLALSLICT